MKIKDLRAMIADLPDDMEVIQWDGKEETYVQAGPNLEEKTFGNHPTNGMEIFEPTDYPRYLENQGPLARYAERVGLKQVRLERCLVFL